MNMKTTKIKIQGMTCLHCVNRVQQALAGVPGVQRADVVIGEATVTHEASYEQLLRAVRMAGSYQAQLAPNL